jgi:hypothetical protein
VTVLTKKDFMILKNVFAVILLFVFYTLSVEAAPDSGSKETLKESPIKATDEFTGAGFMVFESVNNDSYERNKEFSKMKFFVAPLFRLIPFNKYNT